MSLWEEEKKQPTQGGSLDGWAVKANPDADQTAKSTPSGAPATGASKTASSGSGVTRDEYWSNKEARDLEKERVYREEDLPAIRRNAAYGLAATLVASAVQADAVSFGSAAKGKRFDMMLDYVDVAAERLLGRLNGDDAMEAAVVEPAEEVADDELG